MPGRASSTSPTESRPKTRHKTDRAAYFSLDIQTQHRITRDSPHPARVERTHPRAPPPGRPRSGDIGGGRWSTRSSIPLNQRTLPKPEISAGRGSSPPSRTPSIHATPQEGSAVLGRTIRRRGPSKSQNRNVKIWRSKWVQKARHPIACAVPARLIVHQAKRRKMPCQALTLMRLLDCTLHPASRRPAIDSLLRLVVRRFTTTCSSRLTARRHEAPRSGSDVGFRDGRAIRDGPGDRPSSS